MSTPRRPARSGPVVVIGDAMLDIDLDGGADRLCPDAPVPVVDAGEVGEELCRPGGAALTASLLAAGHEVVLIAPLAEDAAGRRLLELLGEVEGLRPIPLSWSGSTPVKQRVRAAGQTLLRLDRGGRAGSIGAPGAEVRRTLASASAIVVADYGRGVTHDPALRTAIAGEVGRCPVVWDPHPRGDDPVPGVTLVTPNEAEARSFAARLGEHADPVSGSGAHALIGRWRARALAITLGARGVLVSFGDDTPMLVPARPVRGGDVCGAGDCFVAAVAGAMADGGVISEAVETAVTAAGRFVADGGAATFARRMAGLVSPEAQTPEPIGRSSAEEVVAAVRARGGSVVATGGCFDLLHAGHIATLNAARRLGDCLVVCLNSDASVRRLKGPQRPVVGQADRSEVLASLACVDAVVAFDESDPGRILQRLRPDLWVKGGDYAGRRLPEEDLLASWGGRAVVVPYLRGRSTTSLVQAARRSAASMTPTPPVDDKLRKGA